MEELVLHGFWASPFSHRIIWALKLKGISYEYIEENLPNYKSHQLLQHNPVHKKVPVLVHRGRAVAESTVILDYIEETWFENLPLMPQDVYERATARFWIKFGQDKGPILHSFFRSTGEKQEKAIESARQILHILEEQGLGEKKFFNGNNIGLVDISFGWLAHWYRCMEEIVGINIICPNTFPKLHQWIKNFKEVQVVKENLPHHAKLLEYMRVKRNEFIQNYN